MKIETWRFLALGILAAGLLSLSGCCSTCATTTKDDTTTREKVISQQPVVASDAAIQKR